MKTLIQLIACVCLLPSSAWCETFSITSDTQVIGSVEHTRAKPHETLLDIARDNDLGYYEILKANPSVNQWVVGKDTQVMLPKQRILPEAPRRGIVLNVAELRLYYYQGSESPRASQTVMTYPVSVGREAWHTPVQTTKVVAKIKDPVWVPPRSIKEEHAEEGDYLPNKIPGGDPENPLGEFALKLGIQGYLIHGTDESKEFGIGMRVTHGCIRLYPEDIEWLYKFIPVGTTVQIIDQPIKVGWNSGRLLLEVHGPVDEDDDRPHPLFEDVWPRVLREAGSFADQINRDAVMQATSLANGIPVVVAKTPSELPPPTKQIR